MNGKEHAIEVLEVELKTEQQSLESSQESIKELRNKIAKIEGEVRDAIANIAGLKDALHKLKGLDNLEKKNKIPNPE